MCGIVGVVARSPVNQLLYDGMTVLQHRGQDAAGIVTAEGHSFHMHKGKGLVRSLHLNDSQMPLGSNRDRHANIGAGELGISGARAFVNERRFADLPCVLETPGPDRSGPTAEEVALVIGLLKR